MHPLLAIALVVSATLALGTLIIRASVRRPGWRRRVMPWIGVAAGTLVLAFGGLSGYAWIHEAPMLLGPDEPTAEERSRPVPGFEFRLVEDDAIRSLDEFRGRVILLNEWATWCSPCVKELPALDSLQEAYRDRGLVVVTLSDESRETLRAFAGPRPRSTVHVYMPQISDLPQPFRRTFRTLPTTYLIDRDGYIKGFLVGGREYEDFEAKVKKLL